MPVPDFLIVGAMKAGTGSLWNYLVYHPELCSYGYGGKRFVKEPAFFTVNHDKLDYKRYCLRFDRSKMTFESSTDYFHTPWVPTKLLTVNPKCKIIVLVRNPIDRAWSHYWHERKYTKAEDLPFEEAIERPVYTPDDYYHYDYLGIGRYVENIERWLNFPVFVLCAEEFFKDPRDGFLAVQDFLEVKESMVFDEYGVFNKGTYKRQMSKKTRAMLQEYYKPHNEALYELLGKDLGWS